MMRKTKRNWLLLLMLMFSAINVVAEELPEIIDPAPGYTWDSRDYYEEYSSSRLMQKIVFTAEVGDVISFDSRYMVKSGYYVGGSVGLNEFVTDYSSYKVQLVSFMGYGPEKIQHVDYPVTEDGEVTLYIYWGGRYQDNYYEIANITHKKLWDDPAKFISSLNEIITEVNGVCDPTVIDEANGFVAANASLSTDELAEQKQAFKDMAAKLHQNVLIDMGDTPGRLSQLIADAHIDLKNTQHFKLKGKVNNADLLLMEKLETAQTIDLSEAYCVDRNLYGYVYFVSPNVEEIYIPEGIRMINNLIFSDCTGLKHIIVPTTAANIESTLNFSSWYGSSYVEKVTVKAALPPVMTSTYKISSYTTICVPSKSLALYQNASYWSEHSSKLTAMDDNDAPWPTEISANKNTVLNTADLDDGAEHNLTVPVLHMKDYGTDTQLTVNGDEPYNLGSFNFWYHNYGTSRMYFDNRYNSSSASLWTPAFMNNAQLTADRVMLTIRPKYDTWYFFAPPVDVRMEDIIPENPADFFSIYTYDSEKRADGLYNNWKQVPYDGTLHRGQGYAFTYAYNPGYMDPINLPATDETRNEIFRTTNVTLPLTQYESEQPWDANWNFIGNPYPACFDITYLDTESPIVVRVQNSYYTVSPADGDHYVLYPGEAFFIQADGDATELTFNTEGRQLTHQMRETPASARRITANSSRSIFNLQLLNDEGAELDRTRVVVNPKASAAYEIGRDVAKFTNEDNTTETLYSVIDGTHLSLNERPLADGRFPLGADLTAGQTYTLRLANTVNAGQYQVTVEDTTTGTKTLITDTEGYTFTADSQSASRLMLHIGNGGVTEIEPVATNGAADSMFDLTGRRVSNTRSNGIYIINKKKVVF